MLIIDETLYVPKGATSIIEFTIEDYICQKGDLVVFAVKNKNQPEEDKTELISKEIHIEEPTNVIEIKLNHEDTKDMELKEYSYGLNLELANNDVFPVIEDEKFILGRVVPNVRRV